MLGIIYTLIITNELKYCIPHFWVFFMITHTNLSEMHRITCRKAFIQLGNILLLNKTK